MFKRSVIAILATAGAAAIALTAYLLWKRSQEEQEEAVPEQEPEDEVVRFVDITNDDQTEKKELRVNAFEHFAEGIEAGKTAEQLVKEALDI